MRARLSNMPPLLILAAVGLAYANALPVAFQFDDYRVIVLNPAVHAWGAWLADLGGIRPLLKLSYTLNWVIDPSPFGFHLFNVLVHGLNALLVYALGLAAGRALNAGEAARPAALAAALLLALHPAQTEAVTYVSGRSTSLMTAFYLASLLTYVQGRASGNMRATFFLSPLLFVCAVLTKEVAVTLPAALWLWELCLAGGRPRAKDILARQWPHWLLLLLMLTAFMLHAGYRQLADVTLDATTLRTQIHGIGYLLSRWVALGGLNIDPDLRLQAEWNAALALQAAGLAGLALAGLASLRRRPLMAFAILWLLLQLLPGNSLVLRWDIANERQLYLAGVGPCLAVGYGLMRLYGRFPASSRLAMSLLFALLGAYTVARNQDYRDEIGLWRDTVAKSPAKARPYNNLGYAYQLAGDHEQARACYRRALALRPDYLAARVNLIKLERATRPPD